MDTRQHILGEARLLFLQHGLKSVSMDDVARHLAMSKKTIYKWFRHKSELVQGTMEAHLRELRHAAQAEQANCPTAVDELVHLMALARRQLTELHPSLYYDLEKYYPESWQLWQDYKRNYLIGQIKANLRRGIAEGFYRTNLDVEVLAHVRLAQIEFGFNPAVFPANDFDIKRVQLACLEHFLGGLVTGKGRVRLAIASVNIDN